MHQNTIDLILKSKLSKRDVSLTDPQINAVREAIAEYALHAVDRYRSNEGKSVLIEAIKILPSLMAGDFMLAIRKMFYNQAKRKAIIRAKMENWKIYVIRTSDIRYVVLSTKDVEINKNMKIFGKQVNALNLHEMADFVAYPTSDYKENIKTKSIAVICTGQLDFSRWIREQNIKGSFYPENPKKYKSLNETYHCVSSISDLKGYDFWAYTKTTNSKNNPRYEFIDQVLRSMITKN